MLKSDSRNLKKLCDIIRKDKKEKDNSSKILKNALLENIAITIENLTN